MIDDTIASYERLKDEPNLWYRRFLVYRGLEARQRSLIGAVRLYQESAANSPKKPAKSVPGSWKDAYEKYDWKFRAELYDAHKQAEIEARQAVLFQIEQAEIERILTEDYAAIHKRVAGLARMAHIIEDSFIDPESGEINYKFLNPDKVREYRGCLDDIAKELGGRTKKTELTGKNGGPLEVEITTEWGGGVIDEA